MTHDSEKKHLKLNNLNLLNLYGNVVADDPDEFLEMIEQQW